MIPLLSTIPSIHLTHCDLYLYEYPGTPEPYNLLFRVPETYCPTSLPHTVEKEDVGLSDCTRSPWLRQDGYLWWESTRCDTLKCCFRLLLVELFQIGWKELADEVHDEILAMARRGYSVC